MAADNSFFQVAPPPIPLAYRLNLIAVTGHGNFMHHNCLPPIRCQKTRFLPKTSRLTASASCHGICARRAPTRSG